MLLSINLQSDQIQAIFIDLNIFFITSCISHKQNVISLFFLLLPDNVFK
jgi:hypothetical protein